jgi:hypothetical protein
MRKLSLLAFVATLGLSISIPSLASAKKRVVVEEEEDEEEETPTRVTVGWYPLDLLGPMVVGGFELRGPGHLSGALIGGYGTPPYVSGLESKKFYEIAGQLRYYAGGSFDGGIHVGAEVQWLGGPTSVDATAAGANLSIGGFVGFKYVLRAGLSIDSQIGIRGVVVRQKLDEGIERTGKDTQLLTRFMIGWTF